MNRFPKILQRLYRGYNKLAGTSFNVGYITEDNIPHAQIFLEKFFYPVEPLCAFLKLDKRPSSLKQLESYSLMFLRSKVSLVVTNRNNEIIGLCLNRICKCYGRTWKCDDPEFQKIVALMDKIDHDYNLFQSYDIDKYMHLGILCVKPEFQGQGIGTKLMDLTQQVGKQQDLKLLKICCTDHYSAKAATRLGFTPYYLLKYKTYKIDGKQVFDPEHPHTEYSVFIQRLERYHFPFPGSVHF